MTVDWGDVPTWLGAIFAGGAFAGALLLFHIEAGRDREQATIRRQNQASLISAWITSNEDESNLALHLQNGSTACVYDMWVLYIALGQVLDYQAVGVVWPSSGNDSLRPIDLTEKAASSYKAILPTIQPSQWDKVMPTLYFRDSANLRWKRDRDGRLTELKRGEWVPEEYLRDAAEKTAERHRLRFEQNAEQNHLP